MKTSFKSTRSYIILLLLLVSLPGVIVIYYQTALKRVASVELAEQKAVDIAKQIALKQKDIIDKTQSYLKYLVTTSQVQNPSSADCTTFLKSILKLNDTFINVGVPKSNGDLLCNALPLQKKVNVFDRAYFQYSLTKRSFAISTFQFDRAAQKTSLNFSYPVISQADNSVIGIAVAVVSLDWWSKKLSEFKLPVGSVAYISDTKNNVIASFPLDHTKQGKPASRYGVHSSLVNNNQVSREFVMGEDGIKRMFIHSVLYKKRNGQNVTVSVGISIDKDLDEATKYFILTLAIFILVMIFMTIFAIWILNKNIIRPIEKLTLAVNIFENGELPQKLEHTGSREIMFLTDKFESMAAKRKTANEKLERMALYDILTGLPNRVFLSKRLGFAMKHCKKSDQSLAVAFMDIDGFKAVNDTYGHIMGDKLLIAISGIMKNALGEKCTLARIGGDEFIAVMENLEKISDSEPFLERLLKAIVEPIALEDVIINVSVSVGVTFYPQDGADVDELIRHADQAMYKAKQAGKNCYCLFDTEQNNAINVRQKNIENIRSALDQGEFVLYYQPKVNMRLGNVIGVEALIRWHHPVKGLLSPIEFLPDIEGHNISLNLGEWVIENALIQLEHWASIGINLTISVNISAYQLQRDNFTNRLSILLAAHPEVNPNCLELEILETDELNNFSQVNSTMAACHKLGVRFALDDFGTGYSSLTYLKNLPAYIIKIDQSFVRDMLEDEDDLAIIEGVVGLANAFKREVIAEGVETVAHGLALLALGCELAQGYGIARPMPADDIPDWVAHWKADDAWLTYNRIE